MDHLEHGHHQAAHDDAQETVILLCEVDEEGLDEKAECEDQSITLFWKK